MKIIKLFWSFFVVCIVCITSIQCIINSNEVNIFAHKENIGIEGYNGIVYDDCQPYGPTTTGTTSSYGEKWYILHTVINNIDNSSHIDDDIKTIYYKFYNEGSLTDEEWLNDLEYYKQIISFGFSKWTLISAYKEDIDGVLQVVPIIELIDVDTLENSSVIEEHIEVHIYDDRDKDYSGSTEFVYDSEILEDTQYYNGVKHAHYEKCIINLYPASLGYGAEVLDSLSQTAAHELGHVLGLEDIDSIETEHISEAHHQELLMGYSNEYANASTEVTYRDMAGTLITRGIHTNSDHKWLFDPVSSMENYKLICSICNCVKYFDSLEGITYDIYKSCGDDHRLESGNMMPVARFFNSDYIKCKYCKYVESIYLSVNQQYMYNGIYNESTHTLKNNVLGLEYLVEEEHNFEVVLEDGCLKCNQCPVCNDGSIHVDYDEEITMECVMNEFSDLDMYLENETKLYKLDVKCKGDYHIQASGIDNVILELFDSDLKPINRSFNVSSEDFITTFDGVIKEGIYYIRARYDDFTKTGEINLNVSSNNEFYDIPIDYLDDVDVLKHMHNSKAQFIYNDAFNRLVEIKLNVNQDVYLKEGSITITNENGDIISKFNEEINDLAYSKEGQKSIIVYLSKNTDYIINIDLTSQNIDNAILSIDMLDRFDFNPFENVNHTFLDTNYSIGDYIVNAYTTQYGKYGIKLEYDGNELCDATMVIIKKTIESNYQPIYSIQHYDLGMSILEFNEETLEFTYNPDCTYYVGIFGGDILENIHLEFYRKITNTQNLIITDPSSGYECGSEVTLNNGLYLGNTLTEGYTRCLFFENGAPSNSRLDYYWYSSDNEILDVSIYGTVLGYNVNIDRQVCINAVYKYNTSIVYQIYLVVKDEEIQTPKYIEYDLELNVGDIYQISADYRWPSTTIQNFTWTTSDSSVALVSIWGTIRAQKTGTVIVQGHYLLNERYYIILRINVI